MMWLHPTNLVLVGVIKTLHVQVVAFLAGVRDSGYKLTPGLAHAVNVHMEEMHAVYSDGGANRPIKEMPPSMIAQAIQILRLMLEVNALQRKTLNVVLRSIDFTACTPVMDELIALMTSASKKNAVLKPDVMIHVLKYIMGQV